MSLFSRKSATSACPVFSSPRYLVRCAAALTALFLAAHLAGLREFTSVLNGTIGSTSLSWETAAILGIGYIGLYLAFVLLVPVLLLAAAILALGSRLRKITLIRTETEPPHPISGRTSAISPH